MRSQAKLGDHHAGIIGDLIGSRLLDQLGVTERHRDRGAKLVRRVEQEQPLLFKQAQVLPGDALHLLECRQPLLEGGKPPPPVPDHHQEHHRDQRDEDQVVRILLAVDDLGPDDPAGGQGHHRQRQQGGLQPPQAERVGQRQAYPDGQERHGLPFRKQPHRRQVQRDENRPEDVPAR